ncbi:MAG: 3-dehydroquinate synthase family protein [Bdellovibrionota bacterium]
MAVRAGEELKDLARFPSHVSKFSRLADEVPARSLTVVAIGGGTVGDFAGFLASVYKRGVRLVHVPSTWLSAIDSSHGGKTALNTSGAKNQLGSFHLADEVFLVRSLLESQPSERARDAMAELAKIALIDGSAWTKKFATSRLEGSSLIWKFLKPAIEAKMKIVARDPRERTGLRQVLNLGHTLGHVIEAELGWSHGRSIAQGLFFALELGESMAIMSERDFEKAASLLAHLGLNPERPPRPMKASRVRSLLAKDKKRQARGSVTFVFLKRPGRAVRREVPIETLVKEATRIGWVAR